VPFDDRYNESFAATMLEHGQARVTGVPEYLGMRFTEIGPGFLVCELELRPELLNPVGVAHGAVVASMVDHVLGSAVAPLMPAGYWPATLEFKINYLAPAREGTISTRAEVRSMSTRTAVVAVDCTNAGRIIATALGTIAITAPRAN
jgi:uncharacterized protein (TIGR00369 family)